MFAFAEFAVPYPQREDWNEQPWLDRFWQRWVGSLLRRLEAMPRRQRRFVARVDRYEAAIKGWNETRRHQDVVTLRSELRRHGFRDDIVARVFAHIRHLSGEVLGMRHLPTQLRGGYLLLHGYLVEMDTGEGKTLTATLAAATAALAGLAVHVVTVNDYLARRDADSLGPLYRALGLTVGLVTEGMQPEQKRQAYGADIVYCTNKILVFDYLRDRLELGSRMNSLGLAMDKLVAGNAPKVLLRGLQFAIVDEADSVFIDEARTPLIISAPIHDEALEQFYRRALQLAEQLTPDQDFTLTRRELRLQLNERGLARLAELGRELGGLWTGANRREEMVKQALLALHGFQRDIHYIVRDGKVMLVDENTGRTMPDRSWERGLQQLVELKEGVEITPEKATMGRISYQLFFRRYLRLAGMSGTVREVAGEVADVYGLGVVRVPPYKPCRRRRFPSRLLADADARWHAVIAEIVEHHRTGRAVLVGTRSIAASEVLSGLLHARGIEHQVLNAKQDELEAEIVAAAGLPGRVTIATSMAGRGTDIRLHPEVVGQGGLHVIATERHDNVRVDRQLAGRCARQGDPGSWQLLLSCDDEVFRNGFPRLQRWMSRWLAHWPHSRIIQTLGLWCYALAQHQLSRNHALARKRLLRADFRAREALSFTGEME